MTKCFDDYENLSRFTYDTCYGLATILMEASDALFFGSGFQVEFFPFFAVDGIATTVVDAAPRPAPTHAMPSTLIPVLLLVVPCVRC